MDMKQWAAREVELACKKERDNAPEGEWDYGCACYDSALKAFSSLIEDNHSGTSIMITKNILNRLIDGKALTPIEDTEDAWGEAYINNTDNSMTYQCNRMSSLFKHVYCNGLVKYVDTNRITCVYINKPNISWHNGFISGIINEMFPITMPYIPDAKQYVVYCEDFLVNPINGDYDTKAILYLIKPDGNKVQINRYFKENDGMVEIDVKEYHERRIQAMQLKAENAKEARKPTAKELEDLFRREIDSWN